jgi:hypothetical protein
MIGKGAAAVEPNRSLNRHSPDAPPSSHEYLRFSGLFAIPARDADCCHHSTRPDVGRLPWHLGALLPSIAPERMTINRLTLALVVAAVAVPR